MQQQAAQAYQQTATQTASPRDLEAQLLVKSAAKLTYVQENWETEKANLHSVLTYNRRLWSIFLNAVTKEDNPMPKELRENIANLGLFVFNHTLKLSSNPNVENLSVLININREIAAGLRANGT